LKNQLLQLGSRRAKQLDLVIYLGIVSNRQPFQDSTNNVHEVKEYVKSNSVGWEGGGAWSTYVLILGLALVQD
jgi:hypothetical protein